MKFKTFIVLIFSVFLLALAVVGVGFFSYMYLAKWGEEVYNSGKIASADGVVFEFSSGTRLDTLSQELKRHEIIENDLMFKYWVKYFDDYSKYQAGKYKFDKSVSPRDISNKLRSGEVYRPIELEFTIPEGFTLKQIAKRLEAKGVGSAQEIYLLFYDLDFLKNLGIASTSLEGYFYPATYAFEKRLGAKEVIEEAVKTFFSKLPSNYISNIESLGLTLDQAVTFASLIELETRIEDEKPRVSEVIWNRLKSGEALGIDASIIYGIDDYNGNLRRSHLQDSENKYNTRIHRGLPPTPIGSPSISSLLAVLSPSGTGDKFYVRAADDSGRHSFTKTLSEHNQAVRRYVQYEKSLRQNHTN